MAEGEPWPVDSAMLEFVRDFIESHDPTATKLERRFPFRRLYDHCCRCHAWARRINAVEGGDPEITQISALFHDVGKCVDNSLQGHADAGADVCQRYLGSIGFDSEKTRRIVSIVRWHTEHARGKERSLEARIESDADLLDEVGAMTVLWDCMAVGAQNDQSYELARTRIGKAHDDLSRRPRTDFHTETAWQFYQQRVAFLGTFLQNLDFELGLE